MLTLFRPAFFLFVLLTVVTGIVYPLAVTSIGQVLFPRTANGSVIERNGAVFGSDLIGQAFTSPEYFWSRPSATAPFPNNPASSGASNLGPNNPALADTVKQRIEALRAADPGNTALVPVDLVTASGSGLDPHISPAAAKYQVSRVARIRHLSEAQVQTLIDRATESRQFGLLGEPRVNVLQLNLMLDGKE